MLSTIFSIYFSKREIFIGSSLFCGYPYKNQCGLEVKIILSIENDEEPFYYLYL